MNRNNRFKKRLGDQSLPGKASIMAQEHDQESTKGQKPALNEIQPGMEVEDTGHELGESDISKPQVTAVIRDEQGQVKYLIVSKGLLFKKKVVVPASRIKEVKLEPENKKGPGEVVIETNLEDEQELTKRSLDILSDIKKGDILAGAQEALQTAEGLEALEAESKQEESKQPHPSQPSEEAGEEEQESPQEHAAHPRILQLLKDIGPGFLAGMSGNDATAVTSYAINGATAGYGQLWLMLLTTPMYQAVEYSCSKIGRTTKGGLDATLRGYSNGWVAGMAGLALLGATISPYSMYWQMRAEIEEKRPGTMKQQFREASIDVASGTIGGNLVSYFIIITTASTLFVHHQSIQTAADAASSLGPLVGPFAKYLFACGLIGAALIAIPIMSASSAYAVADTFGWPAGLSEHPWQAEGFYIVLTASMLVGMAFALLRIDPIKLSFYANVFTGVPAPVMVIYLMAIGNSRKIMGEHRLGWLTNFFLAVTALVLVAGSVLFFYGLATGQGGS